MEPYFLIPLLVLFSLLPIVLAFAAGVSFDRRKARAGTRLLIGWVLTVSVATGLLVYTFVTYPTWWGNGLEVGTWTAVIANVAAIVISFLVVFPVS